MTVSLIIATYNWPRALYLCLDSVMQQSTMPTEILIADDGSGESTREVVEHFKALSPVPLRHIWHEDRGFRAAAIRNKAIAASHCDYVILVDGDMILQRDFIKDHLRFAKKGYYVSGSRGIITAPRTQELLDGKGPAPVLSAWSRGITNRANAMRNPIVARLYCTLVPEHKPRSCNMGIWREDLQRVNGFDEAFEGWGFEDTELGLRLHNSQIRQRRIKFQGIAFHLHHSKAARDNYKQNQDRYLESVRKQRTRCEKGLDGHLATTTGPTAPAVPAVPAAPAAPAEK